METTTWRARSAICALAVAAALVITPTAAQAAPPAEAGDKAVGATARVWDPATRSHRQMTPDRADKLVRDYWTPARLKAAKPAPVPSGTTSGEQRAAGRRATLAKPQEGAASGDEVSIKSGAWYSYTNGKIYWRHPTSGSLYYCSGGAVNSAKNRLVLTAGHCVYTRPGGWVDNWIFIPGYHNGNRPRGTFSAYKFWSSTGWTQDGDRNRDFAFVITYRNSSGQRVVDAAGGHGLTVNPGRPYVHVFGHPGNRTNGSEVQWYCWGTTSRWSWFDSGQKLRCNFGGGASGGPWLKNYSSNGLGYAISNTHGIATNGSGDNYGPYYDDHTADVYWAAENDSP